MCVGLYGAGDVMLGGGDCNGGNNGGDGDVNDDVVNLVLGE